MRIIKEEKKHRSYCSVSPNRQGIPYSFCITGAETEIRQIKDNSKIKREKNIDRRCQRHIVNVWHLSDPPSFSLPTIPLKDQFSIGPLLSLKVWKKLYLYAIFRLPNSASRGVVFWLQISSRNRSENRNGSKCTEPISAKTPKIRLNAMSL